MTAYIAMAAIANLLLGMLLAKLVPPSAIWPTARCAGKLHNCTALPAEDCSARQDQQRLASDQSEEETDAAKAPSIHSLDASRLPAQEATGALPAASLKWDDLTEQLRHVKDRARYCRTAQDVRLVRQAAEEMKSRALSMHVQIKQRLAEETIVDAASAVIDGAPLSAVEMLDAQLETALTNLDALDFSESSNSLLDAIDREINLVAQLLRGAGSDKNHRRPA